MWPTLTETLRRHVAIYLRLALAAWFLTSVSDRFGLWGPSGTANVAWGSFQQFAASTGQLMDGGRRRRDRNTVTSRAEHFRPGVFGVDATRRKLLTRWQKRAAALVHAFDSGEASNPGATRQSPRVEVAIE